MPAPFIVIDGTDGSGKGTQTTLLVERLNREGKKAERISFPSYGQPSAFFVEQYLTGAYGTGLGPRTASVFYALDRFHQAPRIRALLESGTIVVSDRYVSANKGHQTGKLTDPAERKAFVEWVNAFEYGMMGIPKPDLTVLLHVPAETAHALIAKKEERAYLEGGKKRDIHETDIGHLKAAEAAYLELPATDMGERWSLLECTEGEALLSIEAIHERLWTLLQPHLATS
jgi:dTMP kinase